MKPLSAVLERTLELQIVAVTHYLIYSICFPLTKGQQVFWHSSAHIMGEAMERHYGGMLCYGPPIEEGFYYDMFLKDRYSKKYFIHILMDLSDKKLKREGFVVAVSVHFPMVFYSQLAKADNHGGSRSPA